MQALFQFATMSAFLSIMAFHVYSIGMIMAEAVACC